MTDDRENTSTDQPDAGDAAPVDRFLSDTLGYPEDHPTP